MPRRRKLAGKKAAYAGLLLGTLCVMSGCKTTPVSGKITKTPEPTATDRPTITSGPTMTEYPTITEQPTPTKQPSATDTPFPSNTPTVTPGTEPTEVPTKEPTPVPTVPERPTPVPTPEPSATPTVKPTGPAVASPTPTSGPTSTPVLTEAPDYTVLIQSGWQRAEDFFGKREVYFPGIFDKADVAAVPGRYEYVYTAAAQEGACFSMIGEEDATVQQFLDTLAGYPDCRIVPEGEEDYCYEYTAEGKRVYGRIYSCNYEGQQGRMRLELVCLSESELCGQEEYTFYLR